MATIPCPSCGLPRAEDLYEKAACPLCNHDPSLPLAREIDDEPDHDRPWVIPEAARVEPHAVGPTPAPGSRFLAGVFVGLLVGIAVGAAGVIGWPVVRDSAARWDSAAETAAESAPDPAPEPPDPVDAPSPQAPAVPAAETPPVTPPPPEPRPVRPPVQPVVLGPPPVPAPANPFRPAAPRATVVEGPEVYAPLVQPGSTLVARGKVKRLIVPGLERGAVLDCSALEAHEVVVLGPIDGGSRLAVRAPGGRVTLRARVDGRSTVDIRAPGGTVTFETPTDGSRAGSKIDGGASVDVLARTVTFRGRIAGAGTKVAVTLTTEGGLAFAEIDGPARLEYGKADPDDPDPDVIRGRVSPASVVKKVE